jgi:hypothetical protein
MTKSNLPSNEVPFSATALPKPSLTFSERQARGFTFPAVRAGSGAAGSAKGDVLARTTDACTPAGALFEAALWEFIEQPEMRNRMPADTNNATFFIMFPHKMFDDGRRLTIHKSGFSPADFE